MRISRRDLCVLLPGMILPAALLADSRAAQNSMSTDAAHTTSQAPATPDAQTPAAPPELIASGAYPLDKMAVTKSPASEAHHIFMGKLATGELVEVHETILPVGGSPHPPHHHLHSEMWLVREGTVEFTVDGKVYQIGPGSAGFAASMTEHGIKNAGSTPAKYFVVAIGPGAV
ncbi:MAG: cupin domain-containing protein [Candidatus Acidiferrales bacterium]